MIDCNNAKFGKKHFQLHLVLSTWESEDTPFVLLFGFVRTIYVILAINKKLSHELYMAVIMYCSSGEKLDYTTAWQKNRKASSRWKSKEHTNRFWNTTWKRPDAENDCLHYSAVKLINIIQTFNTGAFFFSMDGWMESWHFMKLVKRVSRAQI